MRRLTVSIEEDQAQDHAERVHVKLLLRAVPGVASIEVAHPHSCEHHTRHAQHLGTSHVPRQGTHSTPALRDPLHHTCKRDGKVEREKCQRKV